MSFLALLNPHLADFTGVPLSYFLLRKRALKKYNYLNALVKSFNNNDYINVVIDPNLSSIFKEEIFIKLPFFVRSFISKIEFIIWQKINSQNKYKLVNLNSLENYIIISFAFKNYDNGKNSYLALKKAKKIILHLSHYFVRTKEIVRFATAIKNNLVIATDNALTDNLLFKKYFKKFDNQIILPFLCREVFVYPKKDFSKRSIQIISTGTFHDYSLIKNQIAYKFFRDVYPKFSFHKYRESLYYLKNKLEKNNWLILCNPYKKENNLNLISNFFNQIFLNVGLQKNYFKIDIKKLYQNSKYSFIDSETSGAIAIGIIESAACGCIPIVEDKYMKGLPFIPYQDFIPIENKFKNPEKFFQHILNVASNDQKIDPKILSKRFKSFFSEKKLVNYSMDIIKLL